MVYEWKSASRIKANAQEAGKLFEQLEAENDLTAARVVEESRAESAVLHGEFEWNDTKAANKYREHQARNIINAITIKTVATDSDDEIPATIRASSCGVISTPTTSRVSSSAACSATRSI